MTLRARELALERGARVCFDPNIRPNRWGGDPRPAAEASRDLIAGSTLVRANRDEAIAIAGVDDPREAAAELAALGAELAVVTLGAEGAVIRGACEAEAPAPAVEVVSTLGAGDAFMGTLVAGLAERDWDLRRAPMRRWFRRSRPPPRPVRAGRRSTRVTPPAANPPGGSWKRARPAHPRPRPRRPAPSGSRSGA